MAIVQIINTDEEIKEILCSILENDDNIKDLIKKILLEDGEKEQIVAAGEDSTQEQIDNRDNQIKELGEKVTGLDNKLKAAKDKIQGMEQTISELNSNLKVERGKVDTITGERDEKQREIDRITKEITALNGTINEKEDKIKDLIKQVDECTKNIEKIKKNLGKCENDLNNANEKNEELKGKLQQRFADGWTLYQEISEVSDDRKNDLPNVLKCDSFASFICSGAQLQTLEHIWDAALSARRDNKQYADLFWRIFVYCVKLVNLANGKELIEILNPQIGDNYNTEQHSTTGTDSKAQGNVREIILAGYKNTYKKKIEKKSNVRIG